MRKNCNACTRWRQESTDFARHNNGKPRARCRVCQNRKNREARKERVEGTYVPRGHRKKYTEGDEWLVVEPFRKWIDIVLMSMTQKEFCTRAHINHRRLYSIRVEQQYVNYYVADAILTYHNGPAIWELWPE